MKQLFPSLVFLGLKKSSLHALLLPSDYDPGRREGEDARRQLLTRLGGHLRIFEGFEEASQALVVGSDASDSILQTGPETELGRISFLLSTTTRPTRENLWVRVKHASDDELIRKLATRVPQYRSPTVRISRAQLPVASLALSRSVPTNYRLWQVQALMDILPEPNALLAGTAVQLVDGGLIYFHPPVVEVHSDLPVVVDGNSRIYAAHLRGLPTVEVILIRGVHEPLPWPPIPIPEAQEHGPYTPDWLSPHIRPVREILDAVKPT